nr:immunoglobulin heavy chain junction region [Macaca mulatta]MOV49446.1 immunoglobulin heavy chain junction region [Macaca mulatta]MOV49662.1 immunoglobulin heavy chain junction region [Macaca mulatta]MOV49791.1 immunoglobulin heavy chain junction region [Macaca mulatta]MOV49859.1 immunoglobulin heavy chain junction region [Macaca mulatta]
CARVRCSGIYCLFDYW